MIAKIALVFTAILLVIISYLLFDKSQVAAKQAEYMEDQITYLSKSYSDDMAKHVEYVERIEKKDKQAKELVKITQEKHDSHDIEKIGRRYPDKLERIYNAAYLRLFITVEEITGYYRNPEADSEDTDKSGKTE